MQIVEDGQLGAFTTGDGALVLHLWGMQAWRITD
jgi:hypothetical protein